MSYTTVRTKSPARRGRKEHTPCEDKGYHRVSKYASRLLNDAVEGQDDLRGLLIQPGAQLVAHEALEKEATERLGRAHYQHHKLGEPLRGYRDSYESACLRTAEGRL